MPVAYLLGEREFFDHRFRVTPDSLIPRPDTELLVEVTLEQAGHEQLTVADLGTGCGAVGISLALARPGWRVIITDIEESVLNLARENARRLAARNVVPQHSDWLEAVEGPLDAVVSNPPYVPEADPHLNTGDVRHEPRAALAAGPDGLDAIRAIIAEVPERLAPGGWLALEHGHDQGPAVRALMDEVGFTAIETRRDLAGQERVTHGRNRVQ
jgi:release factor glutamine methyltransferase